ncbi:MAG: hypothetical protein ACAI37_06200 [Chthoniobacter sp.]
MQCPKCREVVFIEGTLSPEAEPVPPVLAPPSAPVPLAASADDRFRIDLLEARVEALEAALRDAMAAARTNVWNAPQRQLIWLSAPAGQPPAFSHEQSQALLLNLAGIRAQGITIRTPAGNAEARSHAEWFKSIFERAGWTVRGPEELPPDTHGAGLSLAVPELPVTKDAAATYLALKAAGFETNPILDTLPRGEMDEPPTTMALTLSPGRII